MKNRKTAVLLGAAALTAALGLGYGLLTGAEQAEESSSAAGVAAFSPTGAVSVICYENESGEIALTVNLWYYTESEAMPNAKAQEISDAIGMGGCMVAYDGGAMWIKRGSPWCQNIADESDKNIKRRYLNITVEYLSQN